MKHIVSFSGGKDSTAMLLLMIEKKMPIDEIRFFNCGSWEFPDMIDHIDEVEEDINIPIIRLSYKMSFDYMFNQKPVRNRVNLGYGFPRMISRWCTRAKISTLNKGLEKDDIMYIGYSADEIQRINRRENLKEGFIRKYPLHTWGKTEKDCLDYCNHKEYFWNGLYNYFKRVSCWCCPLKRINELRNLRNYYPELWKRLIDMQKNTWSYFYGKGKTVFDLEKRFSKENVCGKKIKEKPNG